jgi:hypothetical protein
MSHQSKCISPSFGSANVPTKINYVACAILCHCTDDGLKFDMMCSLRHILKQRCPSRLKSCRCRKVTAYKKILPHRWRDGFQKYVSNFTAATVLDQKYWYYYRRQKSMHSDVFWITFDRKKLETCGFQHLIAKTQKRIFISKMFSEK